MGNQGGLKHEEAVTLIEAATWRLQWSEIAFGRRTIPPLACEEKIHVFFFQPMTPWLEKP